MKRAPFNFLRHFFVILRFLINDLLLRHYKSLKAKKSFFFFKFILMKYKFLDNQNQIVIENFEFVSLSARHFLEMKYCFFRVTNFTVFLYP